MTNAVRHIPPHLLGRITVARGATEVASRSAGAWILAQLPKGMLSGVFANYVVSPHLERCEELLDTLLPGVETKEDRDARKQMPREMRVKRIADELSVQSTEAVSNFFFQMFGQQAFDWVLNVPVLSQVQQGKVVFADRTAQLGSVVLLNTALLKPNLAMQGFVSGMLEKHFGYSHEKAADKATRLVNDTVPQTAGMLGSIFMHNKLSKG